MQGSKTPATLVICATLPEGPPSGAGYQRQRIGLPVTWLATCDRLSAVAAWAGQGIGDEIALELPDDVGDSRQRMRTTLARARDVLPDLAAVALRGPVAPAVRGLLVESGIRVAVVEALGATARGSRRPAPAGWRCRNAAWGLWEVELAATRPIGPLSWLGLASMPRLRRRSLHVLRIAGGNAATVPLTRRLERWLGWAGRQIERESAQACSLSELAARLAGHEPVAADRSVLRAA
jgi:hypothetical protein